MTSAASRFLFVGMLVVSLSACSSEPHADKPVAVVLNIDLSPDALLVDGEIVSLSGLSQLLENETKQQPTFASVSIAGDVPMSTVTELMSNLRSSNILGVHYASNSPKQAFYPVTS